MDTSSSKLPYASFGEVNRQVLKLRIQNICCGKEATFIKSALDNVDGILNVSVNIIGRICFVSYNADVIAATEIIDKLNSLHLGSSLMESGQDNDKNGKTEKRLLLLKAICILIMTILLPINLFGYIKHYNWQKRTAIPVIIIGGLPMVWKALLDIKRRQFVNISLLMLVAVGGTIGLQEWLDGCIIVYVFSIADILEKICRYKVEQNISCKYFVIIMFPIFLLF